MLVGVGDTSVRACTLSLTFETSPTHFKLQMAASSQQGKHRMEALFSLASTKMRSQVFQRHPSAFFVHRTTFSHSSAVRPVSQHCNPLETASAPRVTCAQDFRGIVLEIAQERGWSVSYDLFSSGHRALTAGGIICSIWHCETQAFEELARLYSCVSYVVGPLFWNAATAWKSSGLCLFSVIQFGIGLW